MRLISSTKSTRLMLLVAVLVAIPASATVANAEPVYVGKFTLPYEVHWHRALLPAGEYTITVSSESAPALVRSTNGSKTLYTELPIVGNNDKGRASLLITTAGGQHTVRSMNSPRLGVSFIFQAIPKSEREAFAKTDQSEAVMVTEK
jgi:hypothetical protein